MVYRKGVSHGSEESELAIRFNPTGDPLDWTAENTKLDGNPVSGFPMEPEPFHIGVGDAWLMVAPSGRLVMHMWALEGDASVKVHHGTFQSVSTDGGDSWSTPALVSFQNLDDEANTDVLATDDDFVLNGVIYAAARIGADTVGTYSSLQILIKSIDDGATWEKVSTIVADGETPGTAITSAELGLEHIGNDTIITEIRGINAADSYQRVSTDLGLTWGSLANVTSTRGAAGRQRMFTLAHLRGEADWWEDPNLIMCGFYHLVRGQQSPRQICVWLSDDAGDTWSRPHPLGQGYGDAGYGDLFYNGSGYTLVTYGGVTSSASVLQFDLDIQAIGAPSGYAGSGVCLSASQGLGADR